MDCRFGTDAPAAFCTVEEYGGTMKLGLFDMIGLAASLIFAIPVANFGVARLLAGETTVGVALVVVAVCMVVIPYFFLSPEQIVKRILRSFLPRRLRRDKSE
ncbi:DUF7533 family protein [Haloferacaceae archaeon DSL9]